MIPCAYCQRPTGDGAVLCTVCSQHLAAHLRDLATLGLESTFAGRSGRSRSTHTPPRPRIDEDLQVESSLHYDQAAAELVSRIRTELVGWVRLLATEHSAWPTDTLHAMASWLADRANSLRHHEGAEDAMLLVRLTHNAQRRVDQRGWELVGPCPTMIGPLLEPFCDAPVHAAEPTYCSLCDETASSATEQPTTCSHGHVVPRGRVEERSWLVAQASLMTAADIGRYSWAYAPSWTPARLSALVRTWHARGRLANHGYDRDGHRLFKPKEVMLLCDETQRRAG